MTSAPPTLDELDIVEVIQRTAHDFKNPLSIVMGCGDLIAWMAEDTHQPKMKELADDIVNAATRLKGFTDTMVAMTRLERGDKPQPRPVEAHAVLRAASGELGRLASRAKIVVDVQADPTLELLADPDWLGKILFNLLDHALRYAPGGSTVRLEASVHDTAVCLSVADDGPLVADKAAIFSPTKGKTQERQSSGLALTYCARAALAMGGMIGVDDGDGGKGARFWLRLPHA